MKTQSKAVVIFSGVALMLGAGNAAFGQQDTSDHPLNPRKMLQAMDADNDRRISKEEFENGEQMMLTSFDTSGDGTLSAAEIDAGLTKRMERMRERILGGIDTNSDGAIDAQEIAATRVQRFAQLDTNDDGFLDRTDMRELRKQRRKDGNKKGGWFNWNRDQSQQ